MNLGDELLTGLKQDALLQALIGNYSPEEIAVFKETILNNPYIPQVPTERQARFILSKNGELFYGGAAGGGKSSALLMCALQYVNTPKFSALILRKSYTDLSLPGALIPRSHEWLAGTEAVWNAMDKRWTFPNGSTLSFGYLDATSSEYRYQSSEFQYIGFDELTQFPENQYLYLFSRLRKLKGHEVPLRMCSASNPGGLGHDWVKARFIGLSDEWLEQNDRTFIPAKLEDNPYIHGDYELNLNKLDAVTRDQLRHGDWDVQLEGNLFRRANLKIVEAISGGTPRFVRYWDLAGTEAKKGRDPDHTAGLLLGILHGKYYVCDMVRVRLDPGDVENIVKQTAIMDGHNVSIGMEQEPGSSGKAVIDHYARNVLVGFDFRGYHNTGSKIERSKVASAASSNGNLNIMSRTWTAEFINELCAFPTGAHDDQVDALSGAFGMLSVADDSRFLVTSMGSRISG